MNLTKRNYYTRKANRNYWSASLIKEFLDCPARAVATLRGEYVRPVTIALLIGSYVDSYFEGKRSFDSFIRRNYDAIYTKSGSLRADFVKADEMIACAESDPVFMDFMTGDKQTIMTANLFGFPFKAKFDVIHPDRTVDLKTVKDFDPVYLPGQGKVSFADAWNWVLQMAIYREVRKQNDGIAKPCFIAAITKQTPPDHDVVFIDDESMDAELEVLAEKMPLFDAYKQGVIEPPRCGKCAYCRQTKKINYPTQLNYYRTGETDDYE